MRKTVFLWLSPFVILFFLLSAFEDAEKTPDAAYETKAYVLEGIKTFSNKALEFREAVKARDIEKARTDLKTARTLYKMVEFYLESYESDRVKYLNGAPLPWVEFVGGGTDAHRPHGLQVIEEMIFEEEPDFEALEEECIFLLNETEVFRNIISVNPISNAGIFLGLRYSLIRMESLGLPGFDCPVTMQVAEETYASLFTIDKVLEIYLRHYSDHEVSKEIQNARKIIAKANAYLKPKEGFLEFEEIDRLMFIKQYLQPLSQSVINTFESIKEEATTYVRVFRYITHINANVSNIYDPGFLNPVAFAGKNYYGINQNETATPELIRLGEKLFKDPRLSGDNKMSCATCHDPKKAFSDGLVKSVTNLADIFQARNTPSIVYSTFQGRQFTDLRSKTLEDQMSHVILNHEEFNTSYPDIIAKLSEDSTLVSDFKSVFPKEAKRPVTDWTISKSIAAYVRSLARFNSPFDAYMRGETSEIAPEIKRGFNLFMGKAKCGTCHFAPTFYGTVPPFFRESESEVLGVLHQWDTLNPVLTLDSGRYHTQANPIYITSHKTSTIRNVELTAPYMHNGAYPDLETVLDFYNRGGGAGMGLKIDNQTLDDAPLNLTQQEISDIIAFMKSLTDSHLKADSKK